MANEMKSQYRRRIGKGSLYVVADGVRYDKRPSDRIVTMVGNILLTGFKIACPDETLPLIDSKAVIFEGPQAKKIATGISTALTYIAEERLPTYESHPIDGYPGIKIEQLKDGSGNVLIANGDAEIEIPRDCLTELANELAVIGRFQAAKRYDILKPCHGLFSQCRLACQHSKCRLTFLHLFRINHQESAKR